MLTQINAGYFQVFNALILKKWTIFIQSVK